VERRSFLHLAAVTLRAYGSALRALPRTLGERRRGRPLRRLSTSGFVALLDEFRLTVRDAALKD